MILYLYIYVCVYTCIYICVYAQFYPFHHLISPRFLRLSLRGHPAALPQHLRVPDVAGHGLRGALPQRSGTHRHVDRGLRHPPLRLHCACLGWKIDGKIMGKSWENHGMSMGRW